MKNFIFNLKYIVYFLYDGEFVKIGKTEDFFDRIKQLDTGNPRKKILIAFIQCDEHNLRDVEKAAQEYFKKYHYQPKGVSSTEWYTKDILPYIKEYVNEKRGQLINEQIKINNRGKVNISTLYGESINSNQIKNKCHFFKNKVAQIVERAGPYQKERTIFYKGKKVPVSRDIWDLRTYFRKEAKQEEKERIFKEYNLKEEKTSKLPI